MNQEQLHRMAQDKGFIAALDQSGGSTPKALELYGILPSQYHNDDEMLTLVQEMRSRIIKNSAFDKQFILGAILFEDTMNRTIDNRLSADYLWQEKGIVPFLKIDQGLEALNQNGVQLMKPLTRLSTLLDRANECHIFGTKMRSVIKKADKTGIEAIVTQQFEVAQIIIAHGLVPIIEPEVDIHIADKAQAEQLLLQSLQKAMSHLNPNDKVMLKVSLPTKPNLYDPLLDYPQMVRIVALSGGYERDQANALLAQNHHLIASFSRALLEGLSVQQSEQAFTQTLQNSVQSIYNASIK